jgi:hypothetical protein
MSYPQPLTYYWARAHVANLEVDFEREGPWYIGRIFAGIGWIVNGEDGVRVNQCRPSAPCGAALARRIPFVGASFAVGLF